MKISKATKSNKPELLPEIIERLFLVCKNDPQFELKNELEIVENTISSTDKKIQKQDSLLEQSSTLKSDLVKRIEEIDREIERKQILLVESLGGEM